MGIRAQRPLYTLALMGILAILLVTLAVMQYDWVGQNAKQARDRWNK